MTRFVVDAYAWVEYLEGTPKGVRVRDLVENPGNMIITSPVTLAEVLSKFLRKGKDPKPAIVALETNTTIPPLDSGLAKMAGEAHAEGRKRHPDFGLADAFVLATARSRNSKVLTGDPHFKGLPEAVIV